MLSTFLKIDTIYREIYYTGIILPTIPCPIRLGPLSTDMPFLRRRAHSCVAPSNTPFVAPCRETFFFSPVSLRVMPSAADPEFLAIYKDIWTWQFAPTRHSQLPRCCLTEESKVSHTLFREDFSFDARTGKKIQNSASIAYRFSGHRREFKM